MKRKVVLMTRISRFDRTCIVCGHNLGPYGRICDKCGSIQRPVKGDGLPLPPDRYKACERCGEPIPIELQEDICEECANIEEPHAVIWVEDEDPFKKSKRLALISSGVSLAATGAMLLAIIFAGAQAVLIVFLSVAAMASGASLASWVVIARRPAVKIDYYPPVKPEKQSSQQR
jgi:predicted amidophosphoribosyltransferase